METTVKLQVNIDMLFDVMERSLLQEANSALKKKITAQEIGKGLTYTKKSQNRNVKVKVTGWKKPELYEAEFLSDQDSIQVAYLLKRVSDQETEVTYREVYRKKGKEKATFATRLVEKKAVKQAHRMLKAVEKAIMENQ